MLSRVKWTINGDIHTALEGMAEDYEIELEKERVLDLIDKDFLTTFFQPIYSSEDGCIYGYEALTRVRGHEATMNIAEIFEKAMATGTLTILDSTCQENAIINASQQGFNAIDAHLFINVCPETITDTPRWCEMTDHFAGVWDIPRDKIVLEVTEESAIKNYKIFHTMIEVLKGKGYKIAIDDFGAGYGGLKMLSIIEPDFVKIDRHFISNMDKALVKYNLVDAIATACHRLGIKVIAEGIETEHELRHVINIGIELLQGFLLGSPSPRLEREVAAVCNVFNRQDVEYDKGKDILFIGDIANKCVPIHPDDSIMKAYTLFYDNPKSRGVPVVSDGRIVGMLNRQRFLEQQMMGKYGYGVALNSRKTVKDLMETNFLAVEEKVSIEDVARMIGVRSHESLYDDIYVTKNGKFLGAIAVSELLKAMTDKSMASAKNSNPLTGLPGNQCIYREVNKRLAQNMHFDICYFDLDNFKPYNDNYGFEKGDNVIKQLAEIMEGVRDAEADNFNFVGHIGGDDFILITRPKSSLAMCNLIIDRFKGNLGAFHGDEDGNRGFYHAKNRKGELERFELLSLSIGIVSTEVHKIDSFAQLASLSSDVKKAAKSKQGFSIVRDRRMNE
ncbi:MAG: EAL and GGDEF domain-containing protein [Nitrospirae bacterium]|nr:EAL and GGDEF domain-containing protein [Nitrospirota bacterium]